MKTLYLSFLFISIGLVSSAQNDTTTKEDTLPSEDFFELSLDDLMNIEVESATKSKMSIQKAPSVVRVFTEKDFENYGFTTIKDVMNTIPGIQMQEYRAGHQNVWIRGVQARYNNKVLLLIDGVPMRDSYYGNFNIDEMIPLENVKKIEVLNGPGSVLYGANSFSGVISITTKDEGKSAQAAYGSFNSVETFAEYDYKGLYASGKFFQTDGFQPEYMSDGKQRDVNQKASLGYGRLKYKYKDLTVNASISSYTYPYKYRSTKKEYLFTRTPITGSIQYNPKIDETSSINILAYVNHYGFERDKTKYTSSTSDEIKEHSINKHDSQIWGTEFSYSKTAGRHNFILGNSWQLDMATDMQETIDYSIKGPDETGVEESLIDPNVARTTIGFYGQDVYTLNDVFSLTGGLRYDVLSAFDDQFNYRLGITGQKGKVYGKILYGTAYRVPSYREYLTVDAPNVELQPEHLKTLEVQMGYLVSKMDINVTLFNNSYDNFIQEIIVDSVLVDGAFVEIDDEMAFNFKSRNITGLELNASFLPTKGLRIMTGASVLLHASEVLGSLDENVYTSQDLTFDENDLTFLSTVTGFLNTSYTFKKRYTLG